MNIKSKPGNQSGVTLIELMIALTIGAILLVGLASVFINSSSARRELEKSSALIENGRYAISMIAEDLSLAGFYGHFHDIGTAPATLPDPCILTAAGLLPAMAQPLQGYRAANLTTIPDINTANTCEASLLTNANLTQGSDILIIRRADTAVLSAHLATSDGVPEDDEVYLLANRREAVILFGDDSATINNTIVASKAADDALQSTKGSAGLGVKRSPSKAAVTTWADTRKYRVHVYFIAPCSRGSGANGICQAGDDGIPTLKRLALGTDGSNTVMAIDPLVEGIEYMKLEYGIDTSPTTINATTELIGDGIPDSYVTTPTTAQWASVVSARVYLLARSPQATNGHNDTKSYILGSTSTANQTLIAAANDQFKRHVYSAEVRPTNIAGRREIPD